MLKRLKKSVRNGIGGRPVNVGKFRIMIQKGAWDFDFGVMHEGVKL